MQRVSCLRPGCAASSSRPWMRQARQQHRVPNLAPGKTRLTVVRRFKSNDTSPQPDAVDARSETVPGPPAATTTITDGPIADAPPPKATHWTSFLYSYTVPLSTMLAIYLISSAAVPMPSAGAGFLVGAVAAVVVFGITPILDLVLGNDGANPSKEDLPDLAASPPYKHLLRGYALLQMATLLLACRHVATSPAAAWPTTLGLTLSLGTIGAVGFTVAHDLIHSHDRVDQRLAHVQLCSMCYPHWSLSHLSHHVKVATPEDPASARLNEALWAFIPRSVWGNLVDGLRMERQRLKDTATPLWSLKNRMWSWVATPLAMMAGLWALWGGSAVAVMLGQAAGAVALLEGVNYVEHYGLTRRKLPSGRYERTGARHSWNGDFTATNCVAFKIQRHADHHVNAALPFQALTSITEQAPQLPASYPLMVMMATLPPVWFRVMNPIVEAEQRRLDALEFHAAAGQLPGTAV